MPNQVRNKMKDLRKKNGDTLKNLAEKINYDYSNLSKIERGLYKPSISLLRKISEVYSVDISYFLNMHNYSQEETYFTKGLDISFSSEDLFGKYHLVLDGEKLSETELNLVIDIIRRVRIDINKQKSHSLVSL